MEASRMPLRKWAVAFYLFATNLKGVSSMKLHRDLGITQKSAWYLAHRIREILDEERERQADGSYAEGTVNQLVDRRLQELASSLRGFYSAVLGDGPR